MDTTSIGELLRGLNGLEALGIGTAYLLVSGIGKKLWIRKRAKKDNPHKDCPFYPDFKLTLKTSVDRAIKIFEIREYKTIRLQMQKVDLALQAVIDYMLSNYVEELRKRYDSNDIDGSDRDVDYYEHIMFRIMRHMNVEIKGRITRNHILEKNDEAFRAYIEHANRNLVATTSALMDRTYNSHYFLISRADLKKFDIAALEGIWNILEPMWWEIRAIAKRSIQEIEEIENET